MAVQAASGARDLTRGVETFVSDELVEIDPFFLQSWDRSPPPKPDPTPLTASTAYTEDQLAALVPEPEPGLKPPENPEEALRALQKKFPKANLTYLREVSNASEYHVWAMLKDKPDQRVDALIYKFLRWRVVTSNDRSKVKGNGVDWAYLRDTGLITDKRASTEAGGYCYELCLERFDFTRGARVDLSHRDRKVLFERYNNKCSLCGSSYELQAGHRVGVAVAGEDAGGHSLADFQPECVFCNMAKRSACERCQSSREPDPAFCCGCRWAFPENHWHTAGEPGTHATFKLKAGMLAEAEALLRQHGLLQHVG